MSPIIQRCFIRGLGGALVCVAAMSASAAENPLAGTYTVSEYVTPASSNCAVPQDTYYTTIFTYPGPSKTGAKGRGFFNLPPSQVLSGPYVDITDFPATPATGVTTWSGDYTAQLLPGGKSYKGSFSSVSTYVDRYSFVATVTYTYPKGASVPCTTTIQDVDIRTGK